MYIYGSVLCYNGIWFSSAQNQSGTTMSCDEESQERLMKELVEGEPTMGGEVELQTNIAQVSYFRMSYFHIMNVQCRM